MSEFCRRPDWLKVSPLNPAVLASMGRLMRGLALHTVCESARCPNRTTCYEAGTATFMVLGDTCTRRCAFCAVTKGQPPPPDPREPGNIVAAVRALRLRYVVVTSVTRDDLADGGAGHFARTVLAIHGYDSSILVEVLVPDFRGDNTALGTVADAGPAVIAHNVETVPRLYPGVRPGADYRRSLGLLRQAKLAGSGTRTKSGLMLGLGETRGEVVRVMTDLRESGCDFLTIGQYFPPSLRHHPLSRYVPPGEFEEYRDIAMEMGFAAVSSAPLVRSSYRAAEMQREGEHGKSKAPVTCGLI